MTPPNEHSSEGGRDDQGVPYHAESTLSGPQVLQSNLFLARSSTSPVYVSRHVQDPLIASPLETHIQAPAQHNGGRQDILMSSLRIALDCRPDGG